MTNHMDKQYLLNEQYKDASRLNTRMEMLQNLSTQQTNWYRWIFDQFHHIPDAHILELGGGDGKLWQKNQDRIYTDWQITISDFSPGMLQEAQHNLHDSNHPFEFQIIDAQSIPFADASLDIAIANNMLYHVPNLARVLAEIHRVVKADGYFYSSTISGNSVAGMARLIQMISRSDVTSKVDDVGFTIEQGQEQISQWFSRVELRRLNNSIAFTNADQIIAIISSLVAEADIDQEKVKQVRSQLEQQLAKGNIPPTQLELGLFRASGPR